MAVTLATGAIGLLWRRFRKGRLQDVRARELYAFGIVVHLVMLALMLTLPWDRAKHVLHDVGLPVLLVYPLAATVLGLLLGHPPSPRRRRRRPARKRSGQRLFTSTRQCHAMFDRDMRYLAASRAGSRTYGLEGRDLLGRSHYEVFPEFSEKINKTTAAACAKCGDATRTASCAPTHRPYLRWNCNPWRDGRRRRRHRHLPENVTRASSRGAAPIHRGVFRPRDR